MIQFQRSIKQGLPVFIIFSIISAIYIITSHLSIFQLDPYLIKDGDAMQYISLGNGIIDNIPSPFRYRILVPIIASILPFSIDTSLLLITYISLFSLAVILLSLSYQIHHDLLASITGFVIIFTSRWFLYNFQNPFLTDAFSLNTIGLSMAALINQAFFSVHHFYSNRHLSQRIGSSILNCLGDHTPMEKQHTCNGHISCSFLVTKNIHIVRFDGK